MTAEPPAAPVHVVALCLRFLQRARPYTGRIVLTILVVLIATGSKTVQAFLVKPVIDGNPAAVAPVDSVQGVLHRILKPQQWDLYTIAALAVVLSAVMFVFGTLRDTMTNWLTKRMVADLRNDVAEHLAYLPLKFHYDRKSGDLISRITNDVTVCEMAANFLLDDAIVHPLMIAWALAGCFYTNWQMTLMACAFFPFYVFVLARLSRNMRKARKKSLEHLGDMTGTMVQTFGGIKTVKSFNTEDQQVREFKEHNESYFQRLMATLYRKAVAENLNTLFMGFAIALVLVGGIKRGLMQAGDLAFFGLAIAMITSSVKEMSKSWNRLLEAATGAERVFHLLDQPRETQHDAGEELAGAASVEFKDVSFAYNATPVLRDITLSLRSGEVIAIVGASGAGKTTLCDLLCRFYDPQAGEVRVGGKSLKQVRRSSLLARMAMVTQETFLFNTTVGENIRYGRRTATPAEIEAAAKAAHIHDFIAGLEKGYDTIVGERGAKLSGGQRQRIAIARAVLRDPAILILDEATSALDAESERAVQQAMDQLLRSKHRITLVIAHRLSTIKNADRILVLDGGRVAEEGRHDDLLARGGVYSGLYQTQFTQ